jgi:hypothetical protein
MKLEELSLDDLDFDLEITGFDTVDLDRLLGPEPNPRQSKVDEEGYSQDPVDRTPAVQDEMPSISQSGDLWLLGPHKLLHGDALEPQSYPALLNDEVVTQAIIDSPYNVPNRGHVSAKAFRKFAMAHGEMSSRESRGSLRDPWCLRLGPRGTGRSSMCSWIMATCRNCSRRRTKPRWMSRLSAYGSSCPRDGQLLSEPVRACVRP